MTLTKQMVTGEFQKYQKLGPYHWRQMKPNLLREFAILSAHYERLLQFGRPWADKFVLDLGCGDGALTGLIAREGATVTGVDLSFLGIQLAVQEYSKRGLMTNFAIAKDTSLPLPSRSFTTVVMSEVIEHLAEPKPALLEIARILTEDGFLILSTPSRMTEEFSAEHYQEYYPSELQGLLEQFFRNVYIVPYNPAWMVELYSPKLRHKIAKFPRLIFNMLCYLKRNPFLIDVPSRYYISLAAHCTEPIQTTVHGSSL